MLQNVLVIDDEPNIRRFITLNLSTRGYEVTDTRDAESALELLKQRCPALILLDLNLPGISGWEFLDLIRDHPTHSTIPVIIITGSITMGDTRPEQYPMVVDVLVKPLSVQQLLYAINLGLDGV